MVLSAAEKSIAPEVMARYEPVIGLEVHAQLATLTKAFCGCSTRFGDPPNTNVCPVCLGLPGALPTLNRRALELAIRASLALQCGVQPMSRFARKNYFYPDLSKGYQISMYELPLATAGFLQIETGGASPSGKRIGITRLHMEEDAAKALHEGFADSAKYTYVDFNRCGVPLIEIVSEPDMRAPAEAHAYLTALKQALEYTEVSDCNMEEGSLRCDANVSVRPRGAKTFGTRTEVKNLNSFRYLQRALEYEIERQIGVLESGGRIEQETRLYNVSAGRTEAMRSKELAHDYRYFPEPDLLPVTCDEQRLAKAREQLPELPDAKRARFAAQYGLTAYDAAVLSATRQRAAFFEDVVKHGAAPKLAANWIQTEYLRLETANISDKTAGRQPLPAKEFAGLLLMIDSGEITAAMAKKIFPRMWEIRQSAQSIIGEEGVVKMNDAGAMEQTARAILAKHPDNVAKYRAGNEGVLKFFMGQFMRETRGQADPQTAAEILKRLLAE
jgi:aspartyl-tRNA(Asn)/glutamyl-tRNA(Gln) amidotransferase subunit B